jgi:hypothetical protein
MTREAIAAQLGIGVASVYRVLRPAKSVLRRPRSGERSCQLQCADAAAVRIFGFRRVAHAWTAEASAGVTNNPPSLVCLRRRADLSNPNRLNLSRF